MTYEDFIGEVQGRGRFESAEAAATAVRATLVTLAEQLPVSVARNLAAQLPPEIARFLVIDESLEFPPMSLDQFIRHIASREANRGGLAAALHHARVVVEVLHDATCGGIMGKVLRAVPQDLVAPRHARA